MHYSQFYYEETRAASNYASPRFEQGHDSEAEVKTETTESLRLSQIVITVLTLGLSAVFFSNDVEAHTPIQIQSNLEK